MNLPISHEFPMIFPWKNPGGGTWNRRPALPWTIWRLRNNEALEAQWRVAELKAYRDPLCLVPWMVEMAQFVAWWFWENMY